MLATSRPDQRKRRRPPMDYDLTERMVDCNAAFEAYAALRREADYDPCLLDNPYFTALQDTAYARFLMLWEAL